MPRSRPLIIVTVLLVVVAIGGFVVYDQVLRGDSAAALTLPTAAPTSSASSATSAPSTAPSSAAASATASSAAPRRRPMVPSPAPGP